LEHNFRQQFIQQTIPAGGFQLLNGGQPADFVLPIRFTQLSFGKCCVGDQQYFL
jgi:hypothetical protein